MATPQYTMKVKGSLDVLGGATVVNGLASDTITSSGDTIIQGNLRVIGGAIIEQSSSIAGAQFSTDSSQPQHFGIVTANTLTVAQSLTTNGTFSATSSSSFTGAISASNTLTASGTVTLGATNKATNILGNSTVAGTLTTSGTSSLQALSITSLTNSGATTLQSTLAVTGTTTLASSLSAQATTLSSLTVNGLSAFSGAVTAPSVTVSTLSNTGNTILTGTVSSGAATVSSLTNNGTTILNDNVTIASGKSITVPIISSTTSTNSGNSTVTGTFSAGPTTVSSLTNTGVTTLNDNVTISATKTLTVPTLNSTTIANNGNASITGTLSVGATTVSSITNTCLTTLNDNITVAATKSLTVPIVNSTTINNSGNTVVSGNLTAGATTVSSITNTGITTLNDSVTISTGKSLNVPILNSTTISNSGNATVTGSFSSGATTVSSLTSTGLTTLSDNVTIAATKTLSVPTINSVTINNNGNVTITGALTSSATAVTSLTNSGLTTLNDNVTIGAGKSITVPTLNSTTISNSGNATVSGTFSSGTTTVAALTNSGTTTLNDNVTILSTKTLTTGPLSNTSTTTSGNTSVGGTFTATGASSLSSLTCSGNTVLNGNLTVASGSNVTTGAISATTIAVSDALTAVNTLTTKDLYYTGKFYSNNALIRFGPSGMDMILPAFSTITASSITASRIRYTFTALTQIAFGVGNLLVPEVNTLKVTVNGTTTNITINPNTINTIDIYCYSAAQTVTSTVVSLYGYTVASSINLALQYVNTVSSSDVKTATQQTFTTAGVPQAATAAIVADTVSTAVLSASGPVVTDNSNAGQSPQPPVQKYTGKYNEVSSVSSATLTTNNALALLPATINTRPGTVISATAAAYNVLNAGAGADSSTVYLATDYSESRFTVGNQLTNGNGLVIPSNSQYASGSYICRSNTSTAVITKPNWNIVIQNLRSNKEPHPLSTTLPACVLEMTHNLSSVDLLLNIYFTDTGPKTITSAPATLSFDTQTDSNTGLYLGFYKQIANTTLAMTNCAGSDSLQTVAFNQIFKQQGSWSLVGNAFQYTYGTAIVNTYGNSASFYCDDTTAVPVVQSVNEIIASRSTTLSYQGGLASITSLAVVLSTALTNIGRYWWSVGPVLSITGTAASVTLSNTNTVCVPVYSDANCTTINNGSINQSSNAYRRAAITVDLTQLSPLDESTLIVVNATNIIGTTATGYNSSVSRFRYDPIAPNTDGARVVFSVSTLYPDTSTASIYDNTKSIVDSDAIYGNELMFYNGFYRGIADTTWQQDFSTKNYSMSPATFPNYTSLTSKARSICYKWAVNSSSMYNTIKIVLNSGTGSTTGMTTLYKFVDLITSGNSGPWKNIFAPLTGSINTGSNGDGGQYKAYVDQYTTSTVVPVTSSGQIYVKVIMTATCALKFSGVTISDLQTTTVL